LASHSPAYLEELFFGSDRRKKLPCIDNAGDPEVFKIEEEADFSMDAFGRLLNFVHVSAPLLEHRPDVFERIASTDEVIDILELAVKYTIPMVVRYGQQSLIKRGPDALELLAQRLPALNVSQIIRLKDYMKTSKI
jgi:hypothetical protein